MLFEDRLLFTGETKKEAHDKAKAALDSIEQKLSEWKGKPIKLCRIEEMKPTTINGTVYYYNIVKPLSVWNGIGKCDFSSVVADREEKYKKAWKLEVLEGPGINLS
ncbi:MAG: hypothetical protein ABF289_18265 [Clostridiales bacterium]